MLQLVIVLKEKEQDIGDLEAQLRQSEYEVINLTE